MAQQLRSLWEYTQAVAKEELKDTEVIDFTEIGEEKVKQTINSIDQALKDKDIDPVIIGFKRIVMDSFGGNIRFAFVFGSAAKRGLKVQGDVRDDLDTFICLEHDDPVAIGVYKSELAKLHQAFGLSVDDDFPAEIITIERLAGVMANLDKIDVSIHSVIEGETFDHLFWAHAVTDKKTGFIGDGRALSSFAKQAISHISRWRHAIMEQIEMTEVVPDHIGQRFMGLRKHEILSKMEKLSPHLIIHLGLNYADAKAVAPKL